MPEVEIIYTLQILDTDNEVADPKHWDFTDIFSNSEILIYTDDYDLTANYTMELIGTYTIYGKELTSTVEFNIELLLPARTYVPGPPDHDYFELFNHTMDISEGYAFSLGPVFGKHWDLMQVEFSMQKVRDFATFDNTNTTNRFEIEKGALTADDVGEYRIAAIARFQNETYTEHYTTHFWLQVRDDNPVVIEEELIVSDLPDLEDIIVTDEEEWLEPDLPKI